MKRRKLPRFRSEDAERSYWARHDASEVLDLEKARAARFPELEPSVRTISLRLPESLIDKLKVMAHARDVPYQSLLKVLLRKAIDEEGVKKSTRRRSA